MNPWQRTVIGFIVQARKLSRIGHLRFVAQWGDHMAETATFGAHWERAALQVNPFNYHGKNAPSGKFADEAAYNSALLKKCKEENISLIAITDHWCVDSAAKLIEEGASQDIVALPGFEANSAEGVHLLVIFEPGTKFAVINAAIGSCGATPGAANGTTGDSYKNILETMTQQGALVVPAHTNVPNSGMLTGRTGVPLVNMVQHQDLHAIAISPQQAPAKDQAAVLQGTAPFNRSQALATIHADDVCHPDTLTSPGATTWFKVSSLTLDSLKLALRTPQTRISLTDPTNSPRALLRGISWVGGFLDNVSVPLAEDLTTFIGGRGTGKSTILESLRYALQLPPLGPDATRDHTSIVNNVLRAGTTIQVTVDAISPKHSRYTITRTVPNPPVVLDASDTATTLKPADIIGTVEVFGQHELAELAQDKSSIALMLERFTGHGANDQEPIEIQSSLETNRRRRIIETNS